MAEIYSARGWEIPPLPWTNLSPPFSVQAFVRPDPGGNLQRHAAFVHDDDQSPLKSGFFTDDYIWDMQHPGGNPPPGLSPFERMHTLAGMVTFGCNIPLFTFAYTNVVPIVFPAAELPDPGDVRDKAKWLNYFDPDDVLGYPLKSINAAYDAVVDEDIPINVGGLFSSWNPISHTKYWTDNDFTKPAAEFIATFL